MLKILLERAIHFRFQTAQLTVLMAMFAALSLQGCATKLVAVGDWGRPSELGLNQESLKDVRITVQCASLNPEGEQIGRSMRICKDLEHALSEVGAQIVSGAKDKTDFTLTYVERGVSDKRGSGISFMVFCVSLGIIPYYSSTASEAELQVRNERGALLDRVPMRVESVKALGWTSLGIIFSHSTRKQQRELGRRFFKLAQNQMVSQALRIRAEQGETL